MDFITTKWYDVRDCLPGTTIDLEWLIVRCINRDECSDFYFMANYSIDEHKWYFFDEEYEKNGNEGMQVTHWSKLIKLEEEHTFIRAEFPVISGENG